MHLIRQACDIDKRCKILSIVVGAMGGGKGGALVPHPFAPYLG
jgi:hypothetical protein